LNARTTKDRILSPAPLAKLGYPCVLDVMKNGVIKSLMAHVLVEEFSNYTIAPRFPWVNRTMFHKSYLYKSRFLLL
jgi:hypothetical protein